MEALPPLPETPVTFAHPPVGEVAFAVQMAGPVGDDAFALGDFWPLIKDDFPGLEQQGAVPPLEEDFGPASGSPIQFQLLDRPPDRRHWFLSQDQTRLVQVQPDRFVFNWRREPTPGIDDPYPRYEALRQHFFELYSTYLEIADAKGRAPITPVMSELTYINIMPGEDGAARPDLSEMLLRVSDFEDAQLGGTEDTLLNERWRLEEEGAPYGRLYLQAAPVARVTDQAPAVLMSLIARSYLPSRDTAGVISRFDESHNLIVTSFRDMTTPEMHARWGLE